MGSVGKWHIGLTALLTVFSLAMPPAHALNPRFEIDIKSLREKPSQEKIGIPHQEKRAPRADTVKKEAKKGSAVRAFLSGGKRRKSFVAEKWGEYRHTLRLEPGGDEAVADIRRAREVWDRLLISGGTERFPLSLEGGNFSLTLDPEKYPVFPAADGGRIILDLQKTLPPLVKAIIVEKDPRVRIVTGGQSDRRAVFRSLFAAAGFYSVEEGFSFSFGTDPKVTVTSDFKVEKNADSLPASDVFLVNVTERRMGMPTSLASFLEKEGFHLVDFSPPPASVAVDGSRVLLSITDGSRKGIADALLEALSVNVQRDRDIELDDGSRSGVTLTVRADRYHEANGRKIVFSFAEADPVQFTLLKLLEIRGYRVVMLHPDDDFRAISRKILSAFRVSASYGNHHLWNPLESSFDLQISGFMLRGGCGGETVLLTNVPLDPLSRDLAGFKGYEVIEK